MAMLYGRSEHLQAWYWVIGIGHVMTSDDWQPWAMQMIERMKHSAGVDWGHGDHRFAF